MARPFAVPSCPSHVKRAIWPAAVVLFACNGVLACDTPVRRFSTHADASADASAGATDETGGHSGETESSDAGTRTESRETSGSSDADAGSSCSSCPDANYTSTDDGCDGECSEATCEPCDETGPNCSEGGVCEELAPCRLQGLDCDAEATCQEDDGSWSCECRSGYTGNGLACEDLDECELGTHTCDPNAECVNTSGSFTCTCNHGFTGNGQSCQNVDECEEGSHDCQTNEACTDTAGSFTCECKSGFVRSAGECLPRITYIDFLPEAVNADGTVVAGRGSSKVWRWTLTEGVARSLEFDGNTLRVASVSADGQIVTGNGSGTIVRWVGDAPGVTVSFAGIVEPTDASSDGSLVVGIRSGLEAFAWNMADPLPSSPLAEATGSSLGRIYALSGDGNLITGVYPAAQSDSAFRVDLRKPDQLQTLPPPTAFAASAGFNLSTNGAVVGVAWDTILEDFAAVRWEDTEVATLTPPEGAKVTRATSTSGDGNRIIGDDLPSNYPTRQEEEVRAIYWPSPTSSGVFLRSHVETLGVNVEDIVELRDAIISDDGKTIVGTAVLTSGNTWTRGFILRIPE